MVHGIESCSTMPSKVRDIISLIMLKNGVAEDVLIVFCNKKLYLCIGKNMKFVTILPIFI